MKELLKRYLNFSLILSIISVLLMLSELGFDVPEWYRIIISYIYLITLGFGSVGIIIRYFGFQIPKIHILLSDLLILTIFGFSLYNSFYDVIDHYQKAFILFAITILFLRELSNINFQYKKSFSNPAQLFIVSFLILVLFLRMSEKYPEATHGIGCLGMQFILSCL